LESQQSEDGRAHTSFPIPSWPLLIGKHYDWNWLVSNCPIQYQIDRVLLSTVVYVPNATTAVNTVLRNLVWNHDGKDEILYFSTIYGACGKAVDYTCEASFDSTFTTPSQTPVV
jgi:hypothetical protein